MGSEECVGGGVVVDVTEVAVGLRHGCGWGGSYSSGGGGCGSWG